MNLVSIGQQNVILNGNPSKTFWKATYKKFTNFGLQKFRLDFEGTPILSLTGESTFVLENRLKRRLKLAFNSLKDEK